MQTINNLETIIQTQKELLRQLEKETQSLKDNDIVKQVEKLKAKLVLSETSLSSLKRVLSERNGENSRLKNALHDKVYSDKLALVDLSQRKADIYFASTYENEVNRLRHIEEQIKQRTKQMAENLKNNNVKTSDEIYQTLTQMHFLVDQKIKEQLEIALKEKKTLEELKQKEYQKLREEKVTDAHYNAIAKSNNFERFIGLNILNKVGLILIIIGVITASQYTFFIMSNTIKAIIMFVLGLLMLAGGEVLNRKKTNIFSLGITAGGISILYIALSISYFLFGVLSMYPALILCVLITIGAFLLSTRYNSQTIATFALIGGYLPLISIGGNPSLVMPAMVYFTILNLLSFMIAFRKKWFVPYVGALLLNIVSVWNIIGNINKIYGSTGSISIKVITIIYVLLSFLVYVLIPIISSIKTKSKLKEIDLVIISLDTILSCLSMFYVFSMFNLSNLNGLLAIIFAICYICLAKFIENKLENEKHVIALFYLTGLSFVILVVPLQLDKTLISMGWLVEGVVLSIYGILKNQKQFKIVGFSVATLCLFAFLVLDLLFINESVFTIKYLAITLGSLSILAAFIYKNKNLNLEQLIYKIIVVINLWIFGAYIINKNLNFLQNVNYINKTYLTVQILTVYTLAFAFLLKKIKVIKCSKLDFLSKFLSFSSVIVIVLLNFLQGPIVAGVYNQTTEFIFLGILLTSIVTIIGALTLLDLVKKELENSITKSEFVPLIMSIYVIVSLTQALTVQLQLSIISPILTIMYILIALILIVWGFLKRISYIRLLGLSFAVISVLKIFIIDLSGLESIYRIISYFVLGIVLLMISFIYQYFNKRLDDKYKINMGDEKDYKNDNKSETEVTSVTNESIESIEIDLTQSEQTYKNSEKGDDENE